MMINDSDDEGDGEDDDVTADGDDDGAYGDDDGPVRDAPERTVYPRKQRKRSESTTQMYMLTL